MCSKYRHKKTKSVLISSWCKMPALKFILAQVKSIVVPCVPLRQITSTTDRGAGLHAPTALAPGNYAGTHWIEIWEGPEPVWTFCIRETLLACRGIWTTDRPTGILVAKLSTLPGVFSYSAGYENNPSPIESQDSVPCSQESITRGSQLGKLFSSNRALISPHVPTRATGPSSSDFPH